MRALVIGTGPGAAQRVRLLNDREIKTCYVDLEPHLSSQVAETLIHSCLRAWKNSPGRTAEAEVVFVCTPPDLRVPVAMRCLDVGVDALFLEQPLGPRLAIDRLRHAAMDTTVMVGCDLRFAYDVPRGRWAMLDVVSKQPWTGSDARGRSHTVLRQLVDEIDLAYSFNGRIKASRCLGRDLRFTLYFEYENFATSTLDVDWSATAPTERRISIAAIDDGSAITVWHEARTYQADTFTRSLERELDHFLECARTRDTPCKTLDDAGHVMGWATEIAQSVVLAPARSRNPVYRVMPVQ